MKKLNNKGFTLVELLAVIIILAIVVGISIPAITNIINDSKNNALGVAADAAEKYVSEQYALMGVDASMVDADFAKIVKKFGEQEIILYTVATEANGLSSSKLKQHKAFIEDMGFASEDVEQVTIKIKDSGDVCITVNKIPATSQYSTAAYWKSNKPIRGSGVKNTSKGC